MNVIVNYALNHELHYMMLINSDIGFASFNMKMNFGSFFLSLLETDELTRELKVVEDVLERIFSKK